MVKDVRVRFAPSPTGVPHIGNVRSALFAWLYAKSLNGTFILRIEDTDQSRVVQGSVKLIMESLRWLGLSWDEGPEVGGSYGPYFQSERLDLYNEISQKLIDQGKAYQCFCSSQRLSEMRDQQKKDNQHQHYDRKCFKLSDKERLDARSSGIQPVTRFTMPIGGTTTIKDSILGEVSWNNDQYDDFIIIKSDYYPTYHLASVVDDHFMDISHVLRAVEWLSSTPRHVQLYNAINWQQPKFAHLPTILAPDGSKLSKRHGASAALDYRDKGYLPQAMINFCALLGWSLDGKTEIMSINDLVENFSLKRVSKSSSIFNIEKLDWMNGHYIRSLETEELCNILINFWDQFPPEEFQSIPNTVELLPIIPLINTRLKTLRDAAPRIPFFFTEKVEFNREELIQKNMDQAKTKYLLKRSFKVLGNLESFDSESIENALRTLSKQIEVKTGQLLGTLRVAITGQKVAPPLFQTMEILGKKRSLNSIRKALSKIED